MTLAELTEGQGTPGAALPATGQAPQWVMIARTGLWRGHPQGPERITPRHLRAALDYFRRHYKAHGADLPIDYHHGSVLAAQGRLSRAPAAGWITDMELRAGGTELWARVLWTAEAAEDISARRFRYLSPAFLFGAPDRLTGEPVAMQVHSVALTNTPFLTELKALNQSAAACGRADGMNEGPGKGGCKMSLMQSLAAALGKAPEETAPALGLEPCADDVEVARTVLANAARLRGLEERLSRLSSVAEALGVPEDAEPGAVEHAICSLKASALVPVLNAVRERLGLPPQAGEADVLEAIDRLRREREEREAKARVDAAVESGRIPPSQRDFFLACARNDLEATRACLNALMPMVQAPTSGAGRQGPRGARELTEAELSVCRQLGLSAEAFLGARA